MAHEYLKSMALYSETQRWYAQSSSKQRRAKFQEVLTTSTQTNSRKGSMESPLATKARAAVSKSSQTGTSDFCANPHSSDASQPSTSQACDSDCERTSALETTAASNLHCRTR